MRILLSLAILLCISQLGFALTYFGPGTALNCTDAPAPIVINVSDYYLWNPGGSGVMTSDGKSHCINVDTNDVVIDCTSVIGQGNMDGKQSKYSGIYISPGRSNITIYNCRILDFFGSNIYIDGAGKLTYNVTINNTELTYDNSMSNPGDDIACVDSSDITMDRVNAITKASHTVDQSGFGNGAGGRATCENVTVLNSNFSHNMNFGIYLEGDNFRMENSHIESNGLGSPGVQDGLNVIGENHYIYGNTFSLNDGRALALYGANNSDVLLNILDQNNEDGAVFETADFLYVYGNNITDSGAAGLVAKDVRNSTFESNRIWSNGKYGIYITPNILTYNERVSVLSNDIYDNDYGVDLEGLTNSVIDGNDIYTNDRGGVDLSEVYDSDFTNNYIDDNGGWGIHGRAGVKLDNITFYNNMISNNTGDGILIESTTKRLVFEEDTLVDNSGYGMLVDETSGIVLNKTRIYGKISNYFYVEGTSTFDTHDFWLGYNDTVGILWPAMKFDSVETDVTNSNLLLGEDFVSLDASDPFAAELDEPAIVSVTVDGCAFVRYYTKAGFPASRDEIIQTGVLFIPAGPACVGTLATFQVPDFSGYTANGTSLAPQPPGGGGGGGARPLGVSAETICPDNIVEFTVMSGGVPVSSVDVQLTQYDPYAGLIGEELTDGSGKVQFTMPQDAVYRVRFEKDGYYYVNPYVLGYAMCEEEVVEEVPQEMPEEQPPVQEEEKPPEAVVEPEIVPEEPVEEEEIVSEPQPEVVPPEEEAQPAAAEEEGKELCPMPVLLIVLLVIAAGVYYWFAMRKRK